MLSSLKSQVTISFLAIIMSDKDAEGSSYALKILRFHGLRNEDFALWRMRLRAICLVKGLWEVVESDLTPTTEASSSSSSASKSTKLSGTGDKLEKASGIIISALGDSPLRVVIDAQDDPRKMLQLLDGRYASKRTVSRIAVQTKLFRMSYTNQNMESYVDQFISLFALLECMGKDPAIPESPKAPMLLASIDPKCALESTAAALRTKKVNELTRDFVSTTLIDEYNAKVASSSMDETQKASKFRGKKKKFGQLSKTEISPIAQSISSGEDIDIEKTVRALSAALKSTTGFSKSPNLLCDFCDKSGHTEEKCFMNSANPNHKLSLKMLKAMTPKPMQKGSGLSKKPATVGKVELAGSIVERTTISPPEELRTFADCGATIHCFLNVSFFVPESLKCCDRRTVLLVDKTAVEPNKCGELILSFKHFNIRLQNVLLIPSLGYNLVSTGCLADNGIESYYRRMDVILLLKHVEKIVGIGRRDEKCRMYTLLSSVRHIANLNIVDDKCDDVQMWHRRLAHINKMDLCNAHKYAKGIPQLKFMNEVCRPCELGKAHKLPFHNHFQQTSEIGEVVHSDIVGKLDLSYSDGYKYVCTFLDDYSRLTFPGFLKYRSDLQQAFNAVSTKFENFGYTKISFQCSTKIREVHSNGAVKYKALMGGDDTQKIHKTFSPPYTSELNAIAERVNRTMIEAARSMLIQANLPNCLRPFSLKHAIYVRNRVKHSTIGDSPFSVVNSK